MLVKVQPNDDVLPVRAKYDGEQCFGNTGEGFPVELHNVEEPGEFFHPSLGTLITGAARLMLAITERLIQDAGLTWAFCDTDSMALAKPGDMTEEEFRKRVTQIVDWFAPLNPYDPPKGEPACSILKVEDENYRLDGSGQTTKELEPLYCFAVSAKRYVLFNIGPDGLPIIRKASAHGLGQGPDQSESLRQCSPPAYTKAADVPSSSSVR